ncbi:MAG: hypothetical protein LDLANPLL_00518 [Turneriella sp.]|nr:hypothetical protein [Turneriella sp.]
MKVLFKKVIFFIFFLALSCASRWNTIRTSQNKEANNTVATVESELYVNVDGNRMREMQKGERSLIVSFKKTLPLKEETPLNFTLKLYPTDTAPATRLLLTCAAKKTKLPLTLVKNEAREETVAVLDTNDRDDDDPNLSASSISQTGYINFGKPVTAVAVDRNWVLYTLQLHSEKLWLDALEGCKNASIELFLGDRTATANVGEKEIAAWMEYKKL